MYIFEESLVLTFFFHASMAVAKLIDCFLLAAAWQQTCQQRYFFLFQCAEKSTSNDSWKAARSHFDAAGKQPEDFTISSVDLKGTKLEPNSINITFMRKYTRVWAHPLALIFWCQLLKQFWRMDGRTWKKKVRFLEKSPFGSDGSKPDGYFRTLDAFFRTFGRRPDGPQQKKYVWRKKAFACLRCMGKSSKDKLSPKLSNSPACPQLSVETYPHACNNERAKRVQNPKQARSKPWHQTRKREPIVWKSLLLHLQAAKTKMAPATMSCKLAMWHIYLISIVSAVPPWVNITNMQKTVLDFKKSTFGKKCHFSWKTPKIKGRWRVKVYINSARGVESLRANLRGGAESLHTNLRDEVESLDANLRGELKVWAQTCEGGLKVCAKTCEAGLKVCKQICALWHTRKHLNANGGASIHSNLRGGLKVCLQTCEGRLEVCMQTCEAGLKVCVQTFVES